MNRIINNLLSRSPLSPQFVGMNVSSSEELSMLSAFVRGRKVLSVL